jgi:RNA polymerase sigma-70 factor (ECF subfamily)
MDDSRIVDLYWARQEQAISESDKKYGRMLNSLSYSLLSSREDAEECVNDTYIDAWEAMPDARPDYLGAFLSKITRRISIDRFRQKHREKRGGIDNLLSELDECVPSGQTPFEEHENARLGDAINAFLYSQDREKRAMFILRYFYSKSVQEIALKLGIGVPKVKTTLFRMRKELKEKLEKEELL